MRPIAGLIFKNKEWKKDFPNLKSIKNHLEDILKVIFQEYKCFSDNAIEIGIVLGSSKYLNKLNLQFRNQNKPTDVLSFPAEEISYKSFKNSSLPAKEEFDLDNISYIYLGDIAFAHEVILEKANEMNVSFLDYFYHLFIHSVLHLLGYNHIEDDDANEMELEEKNISDKIKLEVYKLIHNNTNVN